jgi:hypothetical protein
MGIRLTAFGVGNLVVFGGAVILVLVSGAYRSVKHSLFYSKVDAVVQSAGTGCSVIPLTDSMRAAIAKSPKLANGQWLDCNESIGAVAALGYEAVMSFRNETKINRRQQATVRFVSPADGRERVTLVALTVDQSRTMPSSGSTLPIYAHKKDPSIIDPYY